MSELINLKAGVQKFKGKDTETVRMAIKDVWFYYLTTAPRPNKGKKFDAKFPAKNSSYTVHVLVKDKKILKELKAKDAYSKVTTAVVDAEDFEGQFQCKPPFEADEYHFLKLSRHASFSDGATFQGSHLIPVMIREGKDLVKSPVKLVKAKQSDDHEDGKDYSAITTTPMIGNGSRGLVILAGHWYEFEGATNQKPVQEQFIIEDLVNYTSSGGGNKEIAQDDLDALGLGDVNLVDAPVSEAEEVANRKSDNKDQDDDQELDDDDDGFATE